MATIQVGDVKYYHDTGDIFKVEVLDIQERTYGKTPGKEYTLRLLEVVSTYVKNPPASGLEFAVWRSQEADNGGYSSWHLLDK